MEQLDNTGIKGTNKEISEKEKSAERFKSNLYFSMVQISDVVSYLEENLKTHYGDQEKQISQRELEEKNMGMIGVLYKIIKDNLLVLKSERLEEINKEYMGVLESSKFSAAEKETAKENYLANLINLVSKNAFIEAESIVQQGNLNKLQWEFKKLQPSDRVEEEGIKRVRFKTQEEAIENIKTIQKGLNIIIKQEGDIIDYGLKNLTEASVEIKESIFLYETKMKIYKQKLKEKEEREKEEKEKKEDI